MNLYLLQATPELSLTFDRAIIAAESLQDAWAIAHANFWDSHPTRHTIMRLDPNVRGVLLTSLGE